MTDIQKKIQDIRTSMEAVGLPEEMIQSAIKKVEATVKEPARQEINAELLKAVNAVVKKKAVLDHMKTIVKGGFTVSFAFELDEESGELNVTEVKAKTAGTRKSANVGGKRATIIVDGAEYGTFAELCKHYSINVGGDSARRAYNRAHTGDPSKYPAYEEV